MVGNVVVGGGGSGDGVGCVEWNGRGIHDMLNQLYCIDILVDLS